MSKETTPDTSAKTPVREIKFRGKRTDNGEWAYGSYHCCVGEISIRNFKRHRVLENEKHEVNYHWILAHSKPDSMGWEMRDTYRYFEVIPESVGQYTGLKDKKGTEIYEHDIVRIRKPYRTTQTHTGDNIPNGSYTEPMEPGVKTKEVEVLFRNGTFCTDEDDNYEIVGMLAWEIQQWDEATIREAISYRRDGSDLWDDPEEGDLQYLLQITDCKTIQELIEHLSGVEVIGNIFEDVEK